MVDETMTLADAASPSRVQMLRAALLALPPGEDEAWTKAGLPNLRWLRFGIGWMPSRDEVTAALPVFDRDEARALAVQAAERAPARPAATPETARRWEALAELVAELRGTLDSTSQAAADKFLRAVAAAR